MPDVLNQTNIKYRQSFYILAIILLIILFIYYVHIALYHCPKTRNVSKGEGKGRKPNKKLPPSIKLQIQFPWQIWNIYT